MKEEIRWRVGTITVNPNVVLVLPFDAARNSWKMQAIIWLECDALGTRVRKDAINGMLDLDKSRGRVFEVFGVDPDKLLVDETDTDSYTVLVMPVRALRPYMLERAVAAYVRDPFSELFSEFLSAESLPSGDEAIDVVLKCMGYRLASEEAEEEQRNNMDMELERSRFEERVFAAYYISTITRNPNVPRPKISGALDFVSQGCLMKDEFCERKPDGDYARKDVSAMWFGWQARSREGHRVHLYPSGPLIQLGHWFSPDQTILHIKPYDDGELGKLKELADELGEGFESDATMYCIFEQLVANSELNWVDANDTGDLTSAPMLGILAPEEPNCDPVVEARWAFMDYQVKSPQRVLLELGYCRFTGGL